MKSGGRSRNRTGGTRIFSSPLDCSQLSGINSHLNEHLNHAYDQAGDLAYRTNAALFENSPLLPSLTCLNFKKAIYN